MATRRIAPLALTLFLALLATHRAGRDASAQEVPRAFKVVVKEGKAETDELPLDPLPHIEARYAGGMLFGLTLDGARITCTAENSVYPRLRIDNQEYQPGYDLMTGQPATAQPLPPGPGGKKRFGTRTQWRFNKLLMTQMIEIVPSTPEGLAPIGPKRRLDTVRISYLFENTDTKNYTVEYRAFVDSLINTNDGALFASPGAPGEILDGQTFQDKTLPKYLQVLENPSWKKPGMVATMTLKFGGKVEGPSKVVLTNTAALNAGWELPVQKAGGDSAFGLYWAPKVLKPGEKRHMVWAYGGGVAGNPDGEGKVSLALGGSFEPGKQFSVLATVEDPVAGQTLTLELPPGLERLEGMERQPVAVPGEGREGVVLWKGRVLRPGEFVLKVRSSTGTTQVKTIQIEFVADKNESASGKSAASAQEGSMGMSASLVHYTGRVQGVGFRDTVADIARDHAVTGWVKNLPDGRVELLVEGTPTAVRSFLTAVRERWKKNIEKEEGDERKPTGKHAGFLVTR